MKIPGQWAALQFGRLMPGLASAWTGEAPQGKQAADNMGIWR